MKITFVIGGARSGKSSFALREASRVEGKKVYIATAEALDYEMKERIDKHKAERGAEWDTLEEPLDLSGALKGVRDEYSVALLDCLTIWLSNALLKEESPGSVDEKIRELTVALKDMKGVAVYMVSNEVGMGIIPENSLARRFRDLAGALNREMAGIADEVYMVTAGIPVKIKEGRRTAGP